MTDVFFRLGPGHIKGNLLILIYGWSESKKRKKNLKGKGSFLRLKCLLRTPIIEKSSTMGQVEDSCSPQGGREAPSCEEASGGWQKPPLPPASVSPWAWTSSSATLPQRQGLEAACGANTPSHVWDQGAIGHLGEDEEGHSSFFSSTYSCHLGQNANRHRVEVKH